MYFTKDSIEKFLEIFHESADAIRRMEGCTHLELLRNIEDDGHFTTVSTWDSVQHLDQYRTSPLFRQVWGRVKLLFARKPVAHSMKQEWNDRYTRSFTTPNLPGKK